MRQKVKSTYDDWCENIHYKDGMCSYSWLTDDYTAHQTKVVIEAIWRSLKVFKTLSKRSITNGKEVIKQMCINVETKHIIVVVYVNNLGLRVHSEVP